MIPLFFLAESLETFSLTGLILQVTIILFGLIFSGIFSGSEVALFSLNENHFKNDDLYQRHASMSKVLKMLDHPKRLLATILIGNTFANIITSVVAAVLTGQLIELLKWSETIVYVIEVVVLTFVLVITGEITPKIISIKEPLKTSVKIGGIIYFFYIILGPIARLIAQSTSFIEGKLPKPSSDLSSEDIRTMAEVGGEQGSLKEDEREIFENVVEFGTIEVREIMTSRVNIVAVSIEDELGEVLDMIREKRVSRMPLYSNDLDNILGFIFAKDLLPYINTELHETPINWKSIARKALFVPMSKKIDDLLTDFKKERTHIAVVVDEYGGTEGLITLDDVLEEIVGNISDETTENEKLYVKFTDNDYLFDAKIDLDEVEEIFALDGLTTDDDEYETLGGLVYHITERIPKVGEKVIYKGLELTISLVENNRIRQVRVTRKENIKP